MLQQKKLLALWIVCISVMMACHTSTSTSRRVQKAHMAENRFANGSVLYADKIPDHTIISADKKGAMSTDLCCYRVGFRDSIIYDQKQRQAWSEYFNYRMEKDWVALSGGDSLKTVFFQPAVNSKQQVYEGVLVFEVPAGTSPDTLFYNASYQPAGRQMLVLKSSK